MHLSAQATGNFATSYMLGSLSVLDGSVSYLYSTLPLSVPRSATADLRSVTQGYRQLLPSRIPGGDGTGCGGAAALLYGRMFLPRGTLEALYLRRMGDRRQMRVAAVSDGRLRHGGTLTAMLQNDAGKWSSECLFSTDVALLGWRGLYNFGSEPAAAGAGGSGGGGDFKRPGDGGGDADGDRDRDRETPVGRFSGGAEVYYGLLNKSAGSVSPPPRAPRRSGRHGLTMRRQCRPACATRRSPRTPASR